MGILYIYHFLMKAYFYHKQMHCISTTSDNFEGCYRIIDGKHQIM